MLSDLPVALPPALAIVLAAAATAQPTVEITSPAQGSIQSGTITAQGTSTGATVVEISIDGGPWDTANGVDSWNFIIEENALTGGQHALRARARGNAQVDFDAVFFTYENNAGSEDRFEHPSSIDNEPLGGVLRVPASYDPDGPPSSLVCYLHGGGGRGVVPNGWAPELDSGNVILIAPDGRFWGLADPELTACQDNPNAVGDCNWCTSAAYVNNPFEPLVGPGEQDILDSIQWALDTFNIDPDRVYLSGFSMGGRGTYQIGLRHPDLFAAVAPLGPASDMYEVFERRPNPPECKEGMASDGAGGGRPADSDITDTLYTITSARFLIENAYNLPVFHAHGSLDEVAFNVVGTPDQYLHGAHMLFDNSWDQPHGGNPLLAFGHTPTLDDLRTRHPGGYDWDYLFTDVAHTNDPAWAPSIFNFLLARTLIHSPDTVVYKTYTDEHTGAYWASIESAFPWTDRPAAIRVTRDTGANTLAIETARAASLTLDLPDAGLDPASPLGLTLARLDEPAYDPALGSSGEPLAPIVRLRGDFAACETVAAVLNGTTPLAVTPTADGIAVGPVDLASPAQIVVTPTTRADLALPVGVLDLADLQAFVGAFIAGEPEADFAPPQGVLDLADLQAFAASFLSGCP